MEVSLKPAYPCCKYTHGPIEATVEAMQALGITANEVEKITVKVTNREVHDLVCLSRERKWNPQSLTDAQFSLPFNVAYAAANGGVDVQTFQPAGLVNPAARALLSRVDVDLDLAAQGEGRGTFPMPGIVKVQTTSGRSIDKTVVYVKGHPKNPMNYEDVAAKFRTCAALGRPGWKGAEAVIDAVRQIEQLKSAGDLARLCAG
jgi:2-methylcitrate dehydratase PrpD